MEFIFDFVFIFVRVRGSENHIVQSGYQITVLQFPNLYTPLTKTLYSGYQIMIGYSDLVAGLKQDLVAGAQ